MASTLNSARGDQHFGDGEGSEGMRLAAFVTLGNLGLIFSVMTVAYIILSLLALKPLASQLEI